MKPLFGLLFIFLLASCSVGDDSGDTLPTETEAEAYTRNQEEIEAFLEANELEATKTESGLHYIITEEGTGEMPTATSTVLVNYEGFLLNGSVFDKTTTTPAEFNLSNLISGFKEGMTYVKEGGKAMFLIPARLAYGPYRAGDIPPYSVIIFEVELVEIL